MILSIVTISYNDLPGLQKTVNSLNAWKQLAQNLSIAWQHIIVDSSPELNQTLIQSLKPPNDWPLIYVVQAKSGIYAAMNEGIGRAQGRYIWFLNSGDWLLDPQALAQMLKTFDHNPQVSLLCATAEFWRNGHYMYDQVSRTTLFKSLVGSNRLCHQAVLYRRSVFNEVGLFDTKLKAVADYQHHFRCYLKKLIPLKSTQRLVAFDMSGSSTNYNLVFSEFKQVHRQFASQLEWYFSIANEIGRLLEYSRVRTLKFFASTKLAFFLKPIWIFFKKKD